MKSMEQTLEVAKKLVKSVKSLDELQLRSLKKELRKI